MHFSAWLWAVEKPSATATPRLERQLRKEIEEAHVEALKEDERRTRQAQENVRYEPNRTNENDIEYDEEEVDGPTSEDDQKSSSGLFLRLRKALTALTRKDG